MDALPIGSTVHTSYNDNVKAVIVNCIPVDSASIIIFAKGFVVTLLYQFWAFFEQP